MISYYKNRSIDFSQPVYVYRCLNRKGRIFSVKQNGLVVAHTDRITVNNVHLIVNKFAKQRAIKEHTRNVHAYIYGMLPENQFDEKYIEKHINYNSSAKLYYNPYSDKEFQMIRDGQISSLIEPIKSIVINKHGVNIVRDLTF